MFDVAHFVWPCVRSFLPNFVRLLVITPHGKGPNYTLLPIAAHVLYFQQVACDDTDNVLKV